MKRKLLLAALCVVGALGMRAQKKIYIETDLTSQFEALTIADNWTTGNGGKAGTVGWACPSVEVNGMAEKKACCEFYYWNCELVGDVLYQTVTGLTPGTYTIELYGAAAFTFGRGFGSTAFTGDLAVDTNSEYTKNVSKIEPSETVSTGVILYAESEGKTYGGEIPICYAEQFNGVGGPATITLEEVVVGESGSVKIGMSKTSTSTNWHVIQLKSVIATVDAEAQHESCLQQAQAALDDEAYAIVTGIERTNLTTAISTFASPEKNATAYKEAIDAIIEATTAFTNAKDAYQTCADIQAQTYDLEAWPYASATKKVAVEEAMKPATSAEDATTKAAALPKAYRLFIESNALAEGVEGAVDMTDKITNPKAESAVASPWTIVKGGNSGGNIEVKNKEPWTDGSDNATHKYFDGGNWGADSWDVSLEQEITLTPGKYLLTAIARASSDVTFSLYAGENKVAIPAIGASGGVFNRGWNDQFIEFDVEKTGAVKIGIQGVTSVIHNWMSFSNFRLVRLAEVELATETEYEALNNAVAENEKKTLGFNQGEYAPYANIEVLTALEEAKTINQEEENAKTYIEELTAALADAAWTANEDDVDAIYNGLFATVTPGANYPEGWVRTNGWGQMKSNIEGTYPTAYYNQPGSMQYGTQGQYTMPLAANTWYKLTFAYRSNENNSNKSVTVSVLNGEGGFPATSFEANPSTSDWKEVEQVFQTGAAGNYVLTLANEGNTWMTNVSITKSAESAANMSVKAGKWGTFVAPFDVTIPEGVKAYKVTGVENEQIVKEEVEETIPANTPVVLLNETEEDIEETVTGAGLPESATVTEGLLTGIYQADAEIPAGSYVLQTQEDEQAFYHVTAAHTGKINRCYLTMPAGNAPLRAIFLDSEEGTTGIKVAEATDAEDGILYNLAGQKVDASYKGIVIKKGKAMLKK